MPISNAARSGVTMKRMLKSTADVNTVGRSEYRESMTTMGEVISTRYENPPSHRHTPVAGRNSIVFEMT